MSNLANEKEKVNLDERWTYLEAANSKAHCISSELNSLCRRYSWFGSPVFLSNPHIDNRCKRRESNRQKVKAKTNEISQVPKDAIVETINNSITCDLLKG